MKHEPGPWTVQTVEYGDTKTDDLCISGPTPYFRDIASISRCYNGERDKEMEQANAALIAAAPETAAMLEEALGLLRELEWETELQGDYTNDYCPLCQNYKSHGHADGCKLAALLARAGEGGGE